MASKLAKAAIPARVVGNIAHEDRFACASRRASNANARWKAGSQQALACGIALDDLEHQFVGRRFVQVQRASRGPSRLDEQIERAPEQFIKLGARGDLVRPPHNVDCPVVGVHGVPSLGRAKHSSFQCYTDFASART